MVFVTKMNGEREKFSEKKAIWSCKKAGSSHKTAKEVTARIKPLLYDGIPTSEIKKLILKELEPIEKPAAIRYDLKDAIARLNPSIHEFEKYVAKLLEYSGYKTIWEMNPKPRGRWIDHEIDVLASKDRIRSIIECKHHYKEHTFTGLDVPMRQWARLDELQEGYERDVPGSIKVDDAWVVTNTKYSYHAIQYANGKGIKLIGWNYPRNNGLNYYIESSLCYPLTLVNISLFLRTKLLERDIVTTNDFSSADENTLVSAGFTPKKIRNINNTIEYISNR